VIALKEKRCINPVCEPGKPCPEFRCTVCEFIFSFIESNGADKVLAEPVLAPPPTTTVVAPLPTATGCINPVCTPGKACPEFLCAGLNSLAKLGASANGPSENV
jgi:hypothetical protein